MFDRLPQLVFVGGRILLLCLLLGLAPWTGTAAPAAPTPAALELDDRVPRFEAWPTVTVLFDADKTLTAEQAFTRRDQFSTPTGAYATLGLRREAVWLRIPVVIPADHAGRWVLDIDYAALNRIDVHVAHEGRVDTLARLGNLTPYSERPVGSRSHALALELRPGMRHELLLRVESVGALILPITISRAAAFHEQAMAEQMLQGVLGGLGLCLLLYSLAQGLSLREPLFAKYALLISGSLWFSLLQWGIGAQYLWRDNLWMELHAGGLSAFVAATGSFLFIEQALAGPDTHRWFGRMMKGGALLTCLSALAFAVDLIDTHQVTKIVGTLGLAPALLGLPGAIRRLRRGDSVGGYLLIAWLAYFVFTAITVAVIKGQIGASFWTMHSFQIGATIDMLVFMRVLGLRTIAIKAAAREAQRERDLLHSLAHTDALTGLANRRALTGALDDALARRTPNQWVAVMLLDLDGFKPINDRFGHAVGDALLVAVGRRLQSKLHRDDLVARLGGDEFIVMCAGLARPAHADEVAQRLRDAFVAPFVIDGHECHVGVSLGMAIAPRDGTDAAELIRRADLAMYSGKRERHREVAVER